MFRPEKMSLLQCIVVDSDVLATCNFLVKRKVLHLVDRSLIHTVGRENISQDFLEVQLSLEQSREALTRVAAWLGPEATFFTRPFEGELAPKEIAREISEGVAELQREIDEVEKKIAEHKERQARLDRLSDTLQSLEYAGVTAAELNSLRNFTGAAGIMPARFLPDLRRSLRLMPFAITARNLSKSEASVLVLTTKENGDALNNALKSVFFTEVPIPEKYLNSATEALDDIEFERWEIREEEAALIAEENKLRRRAEKSYRRWHSALEAHLRVLSAMRLFGKTESTTYISGWLPKNSAEKVAKELYECLDGRLLFDISSPEDGEGEAATVVRSGLSAVPTKFKHPSILRPFEVLVTTYGYPEYDGVDPTFFVAITFLLLFGMMFGDVGQGFIFVLLGAFLGFNKKLQNLNDTGRLLLCVGISSMIFGFLYGSIFGCEEIIPALWLHPAEDSIKLIASAIFCGTIILSLGILLNVWQAILRRNWREALFGQWGLMSSIFYWTAIALFYYLVVAKGKLSIGLAVTALVLPVAAVLVGDIVWGLILKRKALKAALAKAEEVAEGEEEGLAEQLFKPVEIILNLITNTISFMRVGAFGMNHAVMMSVVFILASVGGGWSGPSASGASKVSYILSVIVGNLFVMLLEGLIVFIQCLRLEYYEFFSKFFGGGGVKYDPLRVDDL